MSYSIAIDGPAGAGKSTIAKQVALRKGFIYVDTGAMYRAMALFLIDNGVMPGEDDRIGEKCKEAEITIQYNESEQIVLLNGENVNSLIRTEAVGNMASASSPNQAVREKLVQLQRELARTSNVVMDGRDIGTCVLPDAQVKVYLTADIHTRAVRRYKQLLSKGVTADILEIEKDIKERDHRDMTREMSPLKKAENAVLLDSSVMSVEEVIRAILNMCEETAKQ